MYFYELLQVLPSIMHCSDPTKNDSRIHTSRIEYPPNVRLALPVAKTWRSRMHMTTPTSTPPPLPATSLPRVTILMSRPTINADPRHDVDMLGVRLPARSIARHTWWTLRRQRRHGCCLAHDSPASRRYFSGSHRRRRQKQNAAKSYSTTSSAAASSSTIRSFIFIAHQHIVAADGENNTPQAMSVKSVATRHGVVSWRLYAIGVERKNAQTKKCAEREVCAVRPLTPLMLLLCACRAAHVTLESFELIIG